MAKRPNSKPRTPNRKWAVFESGALGGWHKDSSAAKRRTILARLVKKDGYATVIRRLLQLRNVTKDQMTVKVASDDMHYLRQKFKVRPVSHKGRMC